MPLRNKTSQLCPTPSAEHQEAGDASQLLQTKAHTLLWLIKHYFLEDATNQLST